MVKGTKIGYQLTQRNNVNVSFSSFSDNMYYDRS